MESVLHKRYKIGERLFSNNLGELFWGRDLQATSNQRLLIHYLPTQLLSDYALKQSLGQLRSLGSQAEAAVLKVLDCAWSDTEVCFVLETPEAWSLSVLPALQGQATNLHQKALAITQRLIDQGLITKGIDPSLFLVTPTGDLYLLGTAFLTELQALEQQSPGLLQPQPALPVKKKFRLLPLALLGTVGLVTAGSLGVYQFVEPNKSSQVPVPPQITVSTLDKPHPTTNTTSLTVDETKVSEASSVGLKPASIPLHNSIELAPSPVFNAPVEVTIVNPQPVKQVISTTPEASLVTQAPTVNQELNKPQAPVSNPQASKNLERASEAIQHGHLQTGLYYLRLAKKLEANQEQLHTAAKQLLEQAQLTGAASEVISTQMQMSIRQEFGLEELN